MVVERLSLIAHVSLVVLERLSISEQVLALFQSDVLVAVDGSALELASLSMRSSPIKTAVLTLVPSKGYSHLYFHHFLASSVIDSRRFFALDVLDCVVDDATASGIITSPAAFPTITEPDTPAARACADIILSALRLILA